MLSNWTLRLCLVAVKRFLENTYFPERKMFPWCLVAFQKIFRKIFSGVWKRRKKTQIQKNTSHNPEKNHQRQQIQSDDRAVNRNPRSRQRLREIAISNLPLSPTYEISRSTLHEIAPSIAISIRCDLAKARSRSMARSRDSEITINGDWNVCRRDRDRRGREIAIARALSLSLSHFPDIL